MRILFLTTYFRPESASNAILMTRLAEELVALGHQVSIVTGMPHYDSSRIWDEYRGKFWVKETHGSISITRVYLYVSQNKSSVVGRLLSYVSFNLLSTLACFFAPRFDLLFVPSPPLTNGACASIVSRLRRTPFVYNVQDIYPDVAIRMGILTNPRLIRIFERLERFVYAKAAAVSVISKGFRANLMNKGVSEEKIRIIPNFVDAEFIAPLPRRNSFSASQGWDEKFVVLFAGNVGMSQGLEFVLEAASHLTDIPEFWLAIIGNGASKADLMTQADRMGLKNIQFLPYQPLEKVPEMYASADIGLVPLRRGFSNDSVPSKLLTIMGVSRPIIASVEAQSETAQVISDACCGICVAPEDPLALAKAIRALHADRTKASEMGRRGRAYVEANFTSVSVARQYEALFAGLLAK